MLALVVVVVGEVEEMGKREGETARDCLGSHHPGGGGGRTPGTDPLSPALCPNRGGQEGSATSADESRPPCLLHLP